MEKAEIEGLWTHIHWLSVLEEQGTYTAAAARLGVSKSAVSQRISDLEKATGTRLVTRTTRSVRLTDAGLSLTREVRSAYAQIARSFSSVRDSVGEIRGLVRLTAPVAFARQQLVPHLSGFLQQYPQVRIQLDVSDALSSLAAEGYDLAVRHGFQVPETHVAWKLCDTTSVLVATRDYLQRHGEPRTLAELSGHECLVIKERDHPFGLWRLQGPEGEESVKVTGALSANHGEVVHQWGIDGRGILLRSQWDVRKSLENGKLVHILQDYSQQANIWAVYAAPLANSAKVRVTVEHLRQYFSEPRRES